MKRVQDFWSVCFKWSVSTSVFAAVLSSVFFTTVSTPAMGFPKLHMQFVVTYRYPCLLPVISLGLYAVLSPVVVILFSVMKVSGFM